MEITFEKIEQYWGKDAAWVSEFEVTADFNLHIERKKGGRFLVYQKSVADGEYDIVDGLRKDHKDVIDMDFVALVYPKWIKVVSEAEVTRAVVLPEGVATPVVAFRTEYDAKIYEDRKACYDAIAALLPEDDLYGETGVKLPATVTIQSMYEGDSPHVVDVASWSYPVILLYKEEDGWNNYQCSIIPREDYAIRYED